MKRNTLQRKAIYSALCFLFITGYQCAVTHAQGVTEPVEAPASGEIAAEAMVLDTDVLRKPVEQKAVAEVKDVITIPAEMPENADLVDAGAAMEPVQDRIAIPQTEENVLVEKDVLALPVMPEAVAKDEMELTSLSLDNVPVIDVITMFAKTIDEANIVMGTNNIGGTVTVNIRNVPWEDALNVILDSVGLAKIKSAGNIYTIVPKEQLDAAPMESMVYYIEYLDVAAVVEVAKQLVGEGGAAFAAPGNTLVVRDKIDRLPIIRETLKNIDQPREQVFIEAKFVELTDEARENIGIDWSVLEGYQVGLNGMSWDLKDTRKSEISNTAQQDRYDIRARSSAQRDYYDVNGTRTTVASGDDYDIWPSSDGAEVRNLSWDGGGPQSWANETAGQGQGVQDSIVDAYTKTLDDVRSAILSPAEFSIVLSALRQNNGVKVVSNPKIVVVNEETASIHIGTKEPNIRVSKDTDADTKTVTYTTELDRDMPYFEYGIKLDVTPTINTSNNIAVRIEPTLSRYIREKTAPDGNTFPVFSSKTIKTMFSVMSGRTVAIGGLAEVDNNDEEKKVPVLGSIPVLGRLFSHKAKVHKQNETIIFVTVALANPMNMEAERGLPEETMLTRKYLIEDKTNDMLIDQELKILEFEEKARFDEEMEKYKKYLEKLQRK